ncbi:rhodanese-like domain-containing protein [Botrytis cinerea]
MAASMLYRRAPTLSSFSRQPLTSTFSRYITMTSQRSFSSYLVTPSELSEALKKNPPPRSPHLPAPSPRFFDLDKVCDKRSPYPHMLPDAKTFASAMSALGIRRDDTVVVYDSHEQGLFSAPRVGWTLKVFGHPSVHVLNNFKLWVEEGYPTESGEFWDVDTCAYPIPQLDESKVADFEEISEIVKDTGKEGAEGVQILDARSYGRWTGKDPEPREGLTSGHMKGSISLPMGELLDPTTKTLLPADQLRKIFESKGIDPAKPIVSSCGTGVTATIIDAALAEAYGESGTRKVYDGSWTEFAQRSSISDGLIVKDE